MDMPSVLCSPMISLIHSFIHNFLLMQKHIYNVIILTYKQEEHVHNKISKHLS